VLEVLAASRSPRLSPGTESRGRRCTAGCAATRRPGFRGLPASPRPASCPHQPPPQHRGAHCRAAAGAPTLLALRH